MKSKDAPSVPKLPVLIANGFAPFPLPLDVAVARYRRRGYDIRIVPFSMRDMRDTRAFARHIARETEAVAGDERVNLLGLSMGGVAALCALKRHGIAAKVATFVSVGAPFFGSALSWFAIPTGIFTRTGMQLAPASSFLDRLHRDPLPDGPRYVSIAGEADAVCPPSTALLPGAAHVVEPFGHADLFLDRRLHDVIVSHFV